MFCRCGSSSSGSGSDSDSGRGSCCWTQFGARASGPEPGKLPGHEQ